MFAARTEWDPSPNRLTRARDRLREAGRPILDLTESNPTRCGLAAPHDAVREALQRADPRRYDPDPRGLASAREAVASEYRRLGSRVAPDDLVLTCSTTEAYSFLLRLLADPGDEILVPAPSYPLLDLLARLHDVAPRHYPLSPEADFAVDLDAVRRLAGPRTRALVVISPGNPSGTFLAAHEREALVGLCAERGIALISDEVFSDYAWRAGERAAPSLAGESGALTFALDGISKKLALPQLKLAWIAVGGPPSLGAEALRRLEVIADTWLSVGTPVQSALPALLALRERAQAPILERVLGNRSWLESAASAGPCGCLPAEAGWCTALRVPRTSSDEEWALRLLEEDGVLVHPGWFYDFPVEGHLVLSLLPPPEVFRAGAARILDRAAGGFSDRSDP